MPGYDAQSYVDLIDQRFANPEIADTNRRVAFDGASRHPGFVIPTIHDGLAADTPVTGLALVSACWARYCAGTREDGSTVAPNDPQWDKLQSAARAARADPAQWLEMREYYGDLADQPRFAAPFIRALGQIWTDGVEAAISRYLSEAG